MRIPYKVVPILAALFVLPLAVMAQSANAAPAADPLNSLRPDLIGLSVANAAESAKWYQEKLGFKISERAEMPDAGVRLIVLEGKGIAIELIENKKSFSIKRYVGDYSEPSGLLQGIFKFAFVVDDLDATLAEFTRRNVHISRGVTDLKQFGVKFFLVQDNSGNVIQIFQRTSGVREK